MVLCSMVWDGAVCYVVVGRMEWARLGGAGLGWKGLGWVGIWARGVFAPLPDKQCLVRRDTGHKLDQS